jgi:hypothetical protein
MSSLRIPLRYLPTTLTRKDRKLQLDSLLKSRKSYPKHKYQTRPKLASFHSRKSKHILRAEKMYGVKRIQPDRKLARKTNCSVNALKQIVRKGEGAYFSSGSRPNQTAKSWGIARLASSITGGKASAVDFAILERGCNHKTSKAYRLARPAKMGRVSTRKTTIHQ